MWLSLLEALSWLLLLGLFEPRLLLELRSSLSSSRFSSTNSKPNSSNNIQTVASARLTNNKCATRQGSSLLLGPSATYPDFMFVCSSRARAAADQLALELVNSTRPQPQRITRRGIAPPTSCRSLTGPPYAKSSPQLGLDSCQDSLLANFALASKAQSVVPNEARKQSPIGAGHAQTRKPRQRRRASAILRLTRRLMRLSKSDASQARARLKRATSAYLISSSACAQTNSSLEYSTTSGQRGAKQQVSPTSSLSTLIRKFNHDNYTSVCQQYQQRKQQIASEQHQKHAKSGILIEGLDGLQSKPTSLEHPKGSPDILCRRGGLYYNYSLEASSKQEPAETARINPMLARQPEGCSDTSGVLSMSLRESQSSVEPQTVATTTTTTTTTTTATTNDKIEQQLSVGENNNNSNQETIISNLSSVQELLDKMNVIMEADFDRQASSNNNSQRNKLQQSNRSEQNKQSAGKQEQIAAASKSSKAKQQDRNSVSTPTTNLDYASLDALSLVSVSSEFEYHDINHRFDQLELRQLKQSQHQQQQPKRAVVDHLQSEKEAAELRFPSFLLSSKNAAPKLASKPATSNVPRPKLVNQSSADRKSALKAAKPQSSTSSSLLNLTSAKMAMMKQQPKVISSNTIIKQKGSLTSSEPRSTSPSRVLSLAELNKCWPNSNDECSLPAEQGNVRAKIRKMEQQVSSPNLHQTSQLARIGQRKAQNGFGSSQIPLSKLPVPTRNQPQVAASGLKLKPSKC